MRDYSAGRTAGWEPETGDTKSEADLLRDDKTAKATATTEADPYGMTTKTATAIAIADPYGMTEKMAAAKMMALSRIKASGTDTRDFGYNYDDTCNYGDDNRD